MPFTTKNMKFILTLLLSSLLLSVSTGKDKKILFLGNSYTAQSANFIKEVFKREGGSYELRFGTPGGKDLHFHLTNPTSQKALQSAKWDFVVIQEQSQKPGLGGQYTQGFHTAAKGLCEAIEKQGSKPCFFMTWGRRDGDKRNTHVYPDFITMHGKISGAYEKAAKDNDVLLSPVGQAFAVVKGQDKALFEKLYKSDGSHPSSQGGYLAACVLWGTLTGKDPSSIRWNGSLNSRQTKVLREAASQALKKNKS
tara:strand:- start:14 stop:769 length:756 start_codon:yes stop_codon:yes gene_type:complete